MKDLVLFTALVLGQLLNVLVQLIEVLALFLDLVAEGQKLLTLLLVNVEVLLCGFALGELVGMLGTTGTGSTGITCGHLGGES